MPSGAVTLDEFVALLERLRARGEPADHIAEQAFSVALPEQVAYAHPGYLGLYNSALQAHLLPFAVAELKLNTQVAGLSEAPLLHELEEEVTRQVSRTIWRDAPYAGGILTSGGATSNLLALVCALQRAAPRSWVETGVATELTSARVYSTHLAHASITRAARLTGLGDLAMAWLPSEVSGAKLEARLRDDSDAGIPVVMFAGTLGDSVFGETDLRPDVLQALHATGTYLHADAAWAGALTVIPERRDLVGALAHADSVTIDLHKWPGLPLGTSMLLLKDARLLGDSCRLWSDYAPVADADYADRGIEWSRRSRALTAYGALFLFRDNFADMVGLHFELAHRLRLSLRGIDWQVVNESPFPVVCFTHPVLTPGLAESMADQLQASAGLYVTACTYRGRSCLRAAMINAHTTKEVVDDLVAWLRAAMERMRDA